MEGISEAASEAETESPTERATCEAARREEGATSVETEKSDIPSRNEEANPGEIAAAAETQQIESKTWAVNERKMYASETSKVTENGTDGPNVPVGQVIANKQFHHDERQTGNDMETPAKLLVSVMSHEPDRLKS
jgi:hypothetical protein